MIRSNLVTLLILASLGWVIDGYAEAAKPILPEDSTADTIRQLLTITGVSQEVQNTITLEPRVPMRKPSFIQRPQGQKHARLIVKFTDQVRMRVDNQGVPHSESGQDVDSINVILEELNLTLEPIFTAPQQTITQLIERAQKQSGKAQPDLSGIFYVVGSDQDVDSASLILLHDPRIEWAGYHNSAARLKPLSQRIDDATEAQRRIHPDLGVYVAAKEEATRQEPVINKIDTPKITSKRDEPIKMNTRLGVMGDKRHDSFTDDSLIDAGNNALIPAKADDPRPDHGDDDLPTRDPGACCINSLELAPQPFNVQVSGAVLVFQACVETATEDDCNNIDGVYLNDGSCADPLNPTFVVCETAAPFVNPLFSPLGACCAAGVETYTTEPDCGGLWLHSELSRFDNGSYPSAFLDPATGSVAPSALTGSQNDNARIPQFNAGLNIDFISKTYDFQNMVVPGGDLTVAQAAFNANPLTMPTKAILNTNYSYYAGPNSDFTGGPSLDILGFSNGPGGSVIGLIPKEPIFDQQNATFPYASNTGIAQVMYSFNGAGPAGLPPGQSLGTDTGAGYDPLNLYPGADPNGLAGPWTILWGPIDIAVNTTTGQAFPAYRNLGTGQVAGPNNPNDISGGFTFYSQRPLNGANVYNPNIYLASPDDGNNLICEFGVCAIDCWRPSLLPDDLGCGPETAFAGFPFLGQSSANIPRRTVRESPIISPLVDVPNFNAGCSNYVFQSYCDSLRDISPDTEFNWSGSLWVDLNETPITPAVIPGCQTTNIPQAGLFWWKNFYEAESNECLGPDGLPLYETYTPAAGDDPLKGSCFYSNMNYPSMYVNQFSGFQRQSMGVLGFNPNADEFFYEPCYGGNNGEQYEYCPTYCRVNPNGQDNSLTAQVCQVAPICCDDQACIGTPVNPYDQILTNQELSGWSFICADLANQWKINPFSSDINNPTYNTLQQNPQTDESSLVNPGSTLGQRFGDFNQTTQQTGPFPDLNVLGLTPTYARNSDGTIWDDPNIAGFAPTLIAAPLTCMINYGIQNQCFTTYFSEFQPSLGLASPTTLPPFFKQNNGGCMDFECCHKVCSIVFDPLQDNFNYGSCCDPEFGWTEQCVEKAIQICYENEGGIQRRRTPNFVPLQFHLSQRAAAGPQPFRLFDQATRRLAAAPGLPPTVLSSIPPIPTFPADNWLQSANSVQWVVNGRRGNQGQPLDNTWVAPSVLGLQSTGGVKYGIQYSYNQSTNEIFPLIPDNDIVDSWEQFFTGEPISPPITFYESEGLSLDGVPNSPAGISPATGLIPWAEFLLSLKDGEGPGGPNSIGARGKGVTIAVLDTSAWIQEYVNNEGQLVGAIHEDLGNVILEGTATGDEFIPMGFDPFIFEPQRGTAVLGTIAASQNGFGTDGIALQAETIFFPIVAADGLSGLDREFNAWLSALTKLKAGDVLIPSYPGGGSTDNIWADRNNPDVGNGPLKELVFNLADALEILIVLPMGDAGIRLTGDQQSQNFADMPDNVLLVGGSMPSTLPKRAWSSNWIATDDLLGSELATTCAMTPITTTGGDCNLTRAAISTAPDQQPLDPPGYISREMQARSYTNDFGYLFDSSKAAAAQAAGVAACLQGVSLQWYGAPQPPSNMRAIINNNPRTIGRLPNGDTVYSQAPLEAEGWQYGLNGLANQTVTQQIGLMIDPARAGVDMVVNPLWTVVAAQDEITQAEFIRGYQIGGNYLSLEQPNDNDELIGYSQVTFTFVDYEPDFFVPGAPFNYNASFNVAGLETGEVTDLFIHGLARNKALTEQPSLAVDVKMTLQPDPEQVPLPPTSQLIDDPIDPEFQNPLRESFIYNYTTESWDLMQNTIAAYPLFAYEPPSATDGEDYIGFNGAFDLRLVLTIPTDLFDVESQLNKYAVFYDYVSLRVAGPIAP